jgi:UDP-N-acetylglucosamine transferase subunit ALG13
MHTQNFDRLIKKMDEIAGEINEQVIIQTGVSHYLPKNTKYFKYLNDNQFQYLVKKANIIVAHGGAGTILNVLKNNKKVIVVPRLKRFNENIDDHQIELASVLSNAGKITMLKNVENLKKVILHYITTNYKKTNNNRSSRLIEFLSNYLISTN